MELGIESVSCFNCHEENEAFAYHKMVLTDYSGCQFPYRIDINHYFIVNQ